METFATIDDYVRRFPDDTRDQLEDLLLDATVFIASLLRDSRIPIDPGDDLQALNLRRVTCAVVHRQLDNNYEGFTQFSTTAGPYTESGTLANPNGDMYLTNQEKSTLGLTASGRRGRLFAIRPAIEGAGDDW